MFSPGRMERLRELSLHCASRNAAVIYVKDKLLTHSSAARATYLKFLMHNSIADTLFIYLLSERKWNERGILGLGFVVVSKQCPMLSEILIPETGFVLPECSGIEGDNENISEDKARCCDLQPYYNQFQAAHVFWWCVQVCLSRPRSLTKF